MCACLWKANVINATVSLKPDIYNLPYKGRTNTLKHSWHIHAPTGVFSQDLQIKNYKIN